MELPFVTHWKTSTPSVHLMTKNNTGKLAHQTAKAHQHAHPHKHMKLKI